METPSLVRKIFVASLSGGITFLVTNVSDQPLFPALVLSLLVGGIVLLTQFLLDLEHRQRSVEAALGSLRDDQREAVRRGVRIRRLFVVPHDRLAAHPGLASLLRLHEENGVTVQVLVATDLPPSRRHQLPDMVIFDDEVGFELTSGPHLGEDSPRYYIQTRVTTELAKVRARLQLFDDLWEASVAADEPA